MNTLLTISARWPLQLAPQGPMGSHGPMGPHGGHGGGMMPWGGAGGAGFGFVWQFVGLLMVIALVLAGIYLIVALLRDQRPAAGTDDALAVLRERYARGEIDEEEFEKRASQLSTETAR